MPDMLVHQCITHRDAQPLCLTRPDSMTVTGHHSVPSSQFLGVLVTLIFSIQAEIQTGSQGESLVLSVGYKSSCMQSGWGTEKTA